jgi:uncharacterized protein (TIGR02147 family)
MRDPLFGFVDYRQFIAEALKRRARQQKELAEAIGRAPSAISQVLSHLRALDPELVEPIAAFLGLDAEQTEYLSALVDLEAPSPRARRAASATIRATQRHRAEAGLVDIELFHHWYFPVVLELAGCEGFRPDPAWIAGSVVPPITVAEAANVLSEALRRGALVEREDGTVSVAQEVIATEQTLTYDSSLTVVPYYWQCLELAADTVLTSKASERQVSTTVFRVSESQLARIRARVRELEREIVMIAAEQVEASNRVYQLGIQLYPVSLFTDSTADHAQFARGPGDPPAADGDGGSGSGDPE